jgi:hypothetical protein
MATSIDVKSLAVTAEPIREDAFAGSLTTTTSTGACRVKWFNGRTPPLVAAATRSFRSGSSTRMNVHGCALQADGARRAASMQRSIVSRSTGRRA